MSFELEDGESKGENGEGTKNGNSEGTKNGNSENSEGAKVGSDGAKSQVQVLGQSNIVGQIWGLGFWASF